MAVQSIRAPVQVGNVAGDHLLLPARKMPLGKMNRVAEFNHSPQKIGPGAETLNDSRDLLSSRAGAPEVISRGSLAGRFRVFNDSDFCGLLRRGFRCAWYAIVSRHGFLAVRVRIHPHNRVAKFSCHRGRQQ